MPNPYVARKIEERAGLADMITGILERAASDKRDLNDDDKKLLDDYEKRASDLDKELERWETRARADASVVSIVDKLNAADEKLEQRRAPQQPGMQQVETRSFGQQFIESPQFTEYEGRGRGLAIEFEGFIEYRDAVPGAITTQDWAAKLGLPQRIEVTRPVAPTPFLDAIGHEYTSSGTVEYVPFDLTGPLAGGPIPETDLKPQAAITPPKPIPVVLDTYAHWVPISRQTLEDFPRMQSIVETQLRNGLRQKLQNVALGALIGATVAPAQGTGLAGIREAIAELEALGLPSPSLVLNPLDYAAIDVEAASSAQTGPVRFGQIWGLTPISAPIPQGTAFVGDLRDAVTWFDRNEYAVYLTDSHSDFFIRNTLVVLAEARAEFVPTHPEALRSVPLDSAGSGGGDTSSTAGTATAGSSAAK